MRLRGWCRALPRLVWLGAELLLARLTFPRSARSRRGELSIRVRARWLQQGCRRLLRVLGVRVGVHGTAPRSGLLVCNHLGYLDILVLGALAPAVFVAKQEVRRWPVIGWFARAAGTVFVHRERRRDVLRVNTDLASLLGRGALVVVFPEGTSSDGRSVLPFKSSLLAPALRTGCPVWVGRLDYALEDGVPEKDACYWGPMNLLPHLLNLLGKHGVRGTVRLAEFPRERRCRKALAGQLRSAVLTLRSGGGRAPAEPD